MVNRYSQRPNTSEISIYLRNTKREIHFNKKNRVYK